MTAMDQSAMSEAAREIDKLMGLHPKGFDLSLDRITRLLDILGNPQKKLPPVPQSCAIVRNTGSFHTVLTTFAQPPGNTLRGEAAPRIGAPRQRLLGKFPKPAAAVASTI